MQQGTHYNFNAGAIRGAVEFENAKNGQQAKKQSFTTSAPERSFPDFSGKSAPESFLRGNNVHWLELGDTHADGDLIID